MSASGSANCGARLCLAASYRPCNGGLLLHDKRYACGQQHGFQNLFVRHIVDFLKGVQHPGHYATGPGRGRGHNPAHARVDFFGGQCPGDQVLKFFGEHGGFVVVYFFCPIVDHARPGGHVLLQPGPDGILHHFPCLCQAFPNFFFRPSLLPHFITDYRLHQRNLVGITVFFPSIERIKQKPHNNICG